jgi:hypothetical protein
MVKGRKALVSIDWRLPVVGVSVHLDDHHQAVLDHDEIGLQAGIRVAAAKEYRQWGESDPDALEGSVEVDLGFGPKEKAIDLAARNVVAANSSLIRDPRTFDEGRSVITPLHVLDSLGNDQHRLKVVVVELCEERAGHLLEHSCCGVPLVL